MSFRDASAPDCVIEHSGLAIGYKFAEDPERQNRKQWYPSFLPQTVQEQTSGAFGYDDRPKAVSQPIVFEDWSGGCGLVDETPGATRSTRYSYSRGVDASWGQPCLSPQFTAMSGMTEAPTKFYRAPTNGWYALSATNVWRLTAGEWVSVYTAASPPTDIIEYQNSTACYLFVALGDSTDFIYTTSATFASTTTVTSEKASYFAVRGSTTVEPVLFATKRNGLTRSSVNPIATGNWSNEDQIGTRNEVVSGLVVGNDLLWYLKEEAIYSFDGTNIGTLVDASLLKRTGNGAKSFTFLDRNIYVNYGNRLMLIDTVAETIERFFALDHPELNGSITAVTADLNYAYIFVQNADGNTYVVKKQLLGGGVPHTIAYLGAVTVNAAMVVAANSASPSTTNPVLMIGYGSAARYAILPRDGYRPWEDAYYRFDISGGSLYGAWVDGGAMTYEKYLNAGRIVATDATGAQSVGAQYGTDGSASSTSLVTALADGLSTERVTSEVLFTRIRYVTALSTGDAQHSPRLIALVFDSTPNPPRHRQWTLMLDVGDQQTAFASGEKRPVSYEVALNHLMGAPGKRVTYTDYFGNEYEAKVDNAAPQGLATKGTGTGHGQAQSLVQILVMEIAQNLTVASPFIWGAASTSAGGTPWSSGYGWDS